MFAVGQKVRVVKSIISGEQSTLLGMEGIVVSVNSPVQSEYDYTVAMDFLQWPGTRFGFMEEELEASA